MCRPTEEEVGPTVRRPLTGNPPRYGNEVPGVNKLKSLMKIMCSKAGLQGNYTNHSGKRTCASALYQAGVDDMKIIQRTGHISEKGVRAYKRSNSDICMNVSSVLNPPKPVTMETDSETSESNELHVDVKKVKRECPDNVLCDVSNRPYFSNCQVSFTITRWNVRRSVDIQWSLNLVKFKFYSFFFLWKYSRGTGNVHFVVWKFAKRFDFCFEFISRNKSHIIWVFMYSAINVLNVALFL